MNFSFLLESTGGWQDWIMPIVLILGIVALYFFMIRPQRKREKQEAEERSQLQVGDEITTIGGIIGKVVSIKEDTFVLETTKDRTRIRFLRGAIRSIDVKIAEVAAAKAAEAAALAGTAETPKAEEAKSEEPVTDAPAVEEVQENEEKN